MYKDSITQGEINMLSPKKKEYLVFLFGLSDSLTKEELMNFFSYNFHSVTSIKMKSRGKDGKITGYAFLSLTSQVEYQEILSIQKFFLNERYFFAKPYLQGEDLKKFKNSVKKKRVFVIGIPFSFENDDVRSLMTQFGPIEDAFVVKDMKRGGVSKGYGYATFKDIRDAQRAITLGRIYFKNYIIKIVEFMDKDEQHSYDKEEFGPIENNYDFGSAFSNQIGNGNLNQQFDYNYNIDFLNIEGSFYPANSPLSNFGGASPNPKSYEQNNLIEKKMENRLFNRNNNNDIRYSTFNQFENNHNYMPENPGPGRFQNERENRNERDSRSNHRRRITMRNKDRVRVFTVGGIFIKGMDFNHRKDNLRFNKEKKGKVIENKNGNLFIERKYLNNLKF